MFKAFKANISQNRPSLGARINWGHPAANGLVAYFPVLGTTPRFVELVTGQQFLPTGSNCVYSGDGYNDFSDTTGSNILNISPYNQINDIGLNQPMSIMFRFMWDGTITKPCFFGKSNNLSSANAGWLLRVTSGSKQIELEVLSSGGQIDSTCTLVPLAFVFYNVIITYDGGTLASGVKYYINGRQDPTIGLTNQTGSQASDAAINLVFGLDQVSNVHLRTKLGNIALWKNRALPAALAQELTLNPYGLLDNIHNIPFAFKTSFTPILISKSEALSVSDTVAKLYNYLVKPGEAITLVDSVFIPTGNTTLAFTESIIFTDTLINVLGKGYQNFDIMILLDSPKLFTPFFFSKSEALALSDLALVYPVISVILDGDQLTFSDAFSSLLRGVHKIVETESITILDLLTLSLSDFVALSATFAENILITESFLSRLTNTLGVFSDTFTLQELLQILIIGLIKENDTISLSDFLSISAPETEGHSDSMALGDNAGFLVSIILKFSETLFFSDVVTSFIHGNQIQLRFADGLLFSDDSIVNLQTIITSYLRQYLNDAI